MWLDFLVGKDILRAKQVNINVATWGRLMKRSLPQQCVDSNALTPPTQITSPGQFISHADFE
jgi:protein kinase N